MNVPSLQKCTEHVNIACEPRTDGSMVEHRAVMRDVVSSTPAGLALRVLK